MRYPATVSYVIRPAEPSDAAEIVRLTDMLATHEGETSDFTERDFLADGCGEAAAARFWVAVVGGRTVGFCMGYPGYDLATAARGWHLGDIYVELGARGRGIGRALLRALARHCLERGGEWLSWSVLRANRDAIGFYRRQGAILQEDVARMAIGRGGLRKL